MVCLDTSIIVDFLKGRENAISAIGSYSKTPEGLSTTSITEYELLKYKKPQEKEKMLDFLSRLRIHNFDRSSAVPAAESYLLLEQKGTKINELDVLIAGIASANNEILLTADGDFKHLNNKNIRIIER